MAAVQPGDATAGRLGGKARGGAVQVVVEHGFVIRPRALAEEVGGLVSCVQDGTPDLLQCLAACPCFMSICAAFRIMAESNAAHCGAV